VGSGTGLGLSSAYAIINEHGGTIRCSTQVGEGTRFEIELPAACVPQPAPPPLRQRPVPVGTETILVVDDEAAVRHVLRRMLERSGFRVIECEDSASALSALQSGVVVDAVLIDRSMPGLSGEEAIERVERLGIRVPILVLSGHSNVEIANPNVAAVLTKPITREALITEVRRALDRHPARVRRS
jgi:CheY-like chemotaxis protein